MVSFANIVTKASAWSENVAGQVSQHLAQIVDGKSPEEAAPNVLEQVLQAPFRQMVQAAVGKTIST